MEALKTFGRFIIEIIAVVAIVVLALYKPELPWYVFAMLGGFGAAAFFPRILPRITIALLQKKGLIDEKTNISDLIDDSTDGIVIDRAKMAQVISDKAKLDSDKAKSDANDVSNKADVDKAQLNLDKANAVVADKEAAKQTIPNAFAFTLDGADASGLPPSARPSTSIPIRDDSEPKE